MLHKFNDGSTLYPMSAQRFSLIPVWNGNRILDPNHVAQLRTSIRSPLDLDIKP